MERRRRARLLEAPPEPVDPAVVGNGPEDPSADPASGAGSADALQARRRRWAREMRRFEEYQRSKDGASRQP